MSDCLFRAIAKCDVKKIAQTTLKTSGEIDDYNKKGEVVLIVHSKFKNFTQNECI